MSQPLEQNQSIKDYILSLFSSETLPQNLIRIEINTQYNNDPKTIILTFNGDSINVSFGCIDFNVNSSADKIDTSLDGFPILALTNYNYTYIMKQEGGTKPSKKHVKTSRKHTCKDGISRVVYTKNGKDYVKRKGRDGTFKYVKV